MFWIFLILGGIVLVSIISKISSFAGFCSRREVEKEVDERLFNQMETRSQNVESRIDEAEKIIDKMAQNTKAHLEEIEAHTGSLISHMQNVCDMYDALLDRVSLFSELAKEEVDEEKWKEQLALLEKCVSRDKEMLVQYNRLCDEETEARNKRIMAQSQYYSSPAWGYGYDD